MLSLNCREIILRKEETRYTLAVGLGLEVTGLWQLLNCYRGSKS